MYNTSIRVSEEVRVKLEEYRIKKELHKKKMKLSQVVGEIVAKWLENPTELREYIDAEKQSKVIRDDNITISLDYKDKAKLYKLFGEKYIDKVKSLNLLLYIILVKFLNENFEDFDIKKVL